MSDPPKPPPSAELAGDATPSIWRRLLGLRWTRSAAGWVSLVAVLVVLSPVVQNYRERPVDGFPLSHFPMFSKDRLGTTTVIYLEGVTADGKVRPLSYKLAGRGGLNEVRVQIKRLVREGKADELCQHVAEEAAERSLNVVKVRIVRGKFDMGRFFAGDRTPLKSSIKAECRVPGR